MAFLRQADRILRCQPWEARSARNTGLAAQIAVFGFVYGAVMGLFGGLGGDRWLQVLFAALKVPLLLVGSFAVALPFFFVLNTVAGLRSDFPLVLHCLLASQAGVAVVLASLAPLTALWYLSVEGYHAAIVWNGGMFLTASLCSQWLLHRYYEPLITRHRRHRGLVRTWVVLYVFVGIQMAWILRPFIGAPGAPARFLRGDVLDNAYVIVFRLVWGLLD